MDAFRTLTGGSNFDRKRFKHDIHHFQPSTVPGAPSASTVPAELDFFAAEAPVESEQPKKKDKKRKRTAAVSTAATPIDVAALIRKHKIKLTGLDLPAPIPTLSLLASRLPTPVPTHHAEAIERLVQNWAQIGMKDPPTGIQMASWGIMLANRDILACAPTGSGKTFSFILPLLALNPPLDSSNVPSTSQDKKTLRPRAIVIEPTRELAMQVLRETRRLIHGTQNEDIEGQGSTWKVGVLGEEGVGSVPSGAGKGKKKSKSKKGKNTETEPVDEASDAEIEEAKDEPYLGPIDILITTPLRLVYAIKSSLIDLTSTTHLILDEADKLFELNFLEQTDEILAACSRPEGQPQVRKGMFSATMPSSVEEMAKSVMAGAGQGLVRAIVGHKEAATSTITQELQFVNTEDHKLLSLRSLVTNGQFTPPVLIFVQSIQRAKELSNELLLDGLAADAIHAERTGPERDQVVKDFAEGKVWALVCTDVMGRGIDFKGVKLVVNYDFPQSAMSYIHRIGRTGRAGKEGRAITFFTKADSGHLKTIVNVMRQSGCAVPDWMLALPNPTQDSKKALKMKPIGRKDISKTNGSSGGAEVKQEGRGNKKGPKRERIMGGKGGVFKRREGTDDGDKKGKKGASSGKGKKSVENNKVADEGERAAKKSRKGKVDLDE
ncbi:RNA-dependent ATPase ROK1 [Sporobolomyces koalae]|uniref:RNA-dependent ATPase ROK1 n=1 Tax=Sporobolomyces koalae TaxID=500713 RepID=UPI00317A90DA